MIHDILQQQEPVSAVSSISVGSCDWDHPHWRGVFYPDDLPADWRLSYYANEFSSVLVPQQKWMSAGDELEEWCEDVTEGFRFYLQLTNELPEQQLKATYKMLGNQLGGFVPASKEILNKASGVAIIEMNSKDLRGWRAWLEENSAALSAVFLKDRALSVNQLRDFKSLLELLNL